MAMGDTGCGGCGGQGRATLALFACIAAASAAGAYPPAPPRPTARVHVVASRRESRTLPALEIAPQIITWQAMVTPWAWACPRPSRPPSGPGAARSVPPHRTPPAPGARAAAPRAGAAPPAGRNTSVYDVHDPYEEGASAALNSSTRRSVQRILREVCRKNEFHDTACRRSNRNSRRCGGRVDCGSWCSCGHSYSIGPSSCNSDECRKCPAHSATPAGSTSAAQCVCARGYFKRAVDARGGPVCQKGGPTASRTCPPGTYFAYGCAGREPSRDNACRSFSGFCRFSLIINLQM